MDQNNISNFTKEELCKRYNWDPKKPIAMIFPMILLMVYSVILGIYIRIVFVVTCHFGLHLVYKKIKYVIKPS